MNRKYEFTGETLEHDGHTLRRIRALRDFADVKKGDLGGWIERNFNLSHYDKCWVYDEAKVYQTAEVNNNATVHDKAEVSWDARVLMDSKVYGNTKITWHSHIYGAAEIYDNAKISGHAQISENARVYGKAEISDHVRVYGNARIYGNASIYGHAVISGESRVYENAEVCDMARIAGNIEITDRIVIHGNADLREIKLENRKIILSDQKDFLTITNICNQTYRNITFYKTGGESIRVRAGWFNGSLEEFEKLVEEEYSNNKCGEEHRLAIELAKTRLLETN